MNKQESAPRDSNMQYYKVVYLRPGDNTRHSAFTTGAACVEYKPGEWSEAPSWLLDHGYGLTVVETEEQARILRFSGLLEVWRARGKEELPLPEKLLTPKTLAFEERIDYCTKVHLPSVTWPPGTRMFKRVKLIEKIS